MAVEVQTPTPQTPAIEAGVIDEARQRQRQRRIRAVYVGVTGLVLAGGLAAGLLGGSQRTRHPRGHRRVAIEQLVELSRSAPRISPGLEGGSYGWAVQVDGGGSCCTLPTVSPRGAAVGAIAFWSPAKREDTITALLSSGVRRFAEVGTRVQTTILATLPYGLRLARIRLVTTNGGHGPLRAFSAQGKALGYMPQPGDFRPGARWWQSPASPPAGPCQLRVAGVSGLTEQWGHIAASVKPYPGKIIGRAFFSCASSEYYLHNWPLETAILLDAQRPGARPAAIPGAHPVRGAPGVYDAPGAFNGELTARRDGNAWIVVAGGSGLAQRLEVLRHLTPTIPRIKS
jgi:hypothetical protein